MAHYKFLYCIVLYCIEYGAHFASCNTLRLNSTQSQCVVDCALYSYLMLDY